MTYVPHGNFVGDDQFTDLVSDGKGGTATGTVSVRVSGPGESGDTPTIYLPLILC